MVLVLGCSGHPLPPPRAVSAADVKPDSHHEPIDMLHIGGAELRVVSSQGISSQPRLKMIQNWVNAAAVAVTHYFGRFPVERATIELDFVPGQGIRHGVTYDGRLIRLTLGTDTQSADFADDWKLTHEMFHLGFPDLDERYLYMNEGLSDYLEPIARCRVGELSEKNVWKGFLDGIPLGLPGPGDTGLDHTQSWGRVYWGGTLFWLVADVRVRERTGGKRSLDDAIRAILRQGGDGSSHWKLQDVLKTADAATGTSVFTEVHAQMGEHAWAPDLDALWRKLGVRQENGLITFDDAAPLAAVRRGILARE